MAPSLIDAPPVWTREQLLVGIEDAKRAFRIIRLTESDTYSDAYVRKLRATTRMLRAISASTEANAGQVIQGLWNDPEAFEALRYVTTPPISEDDLKTLADTKLSRRALRDRAAATRVYALLKETLDLRRFPCHHNRPMNRRQTERALASTTALLTAQYIQTRRRNDAKLRQEKAG